MLEELRVHNLGLIASAHLEPGPGLVVVTGETGAGKTLLLGALRLLLGDSVRQDQIGPAADEARVEGRFRLVGDDGGAESEFVAARRAVAGGRSRAYVDGSMVPARILAQRTAGEVEIVAQHDHLKLTKARAVRQLVDGLLDEDGLASFADYHRAWEQRQQLVEDQARLGGDQRALARQLEVARFQADEIDQAGFVDGEDQELAAVANRLRNAEELAEGMGVVAAGLEDDAGAGAALGVALTELTRLARIDPGVEPLRQQAEQVAALTAELHNQVARVAADLDHDPRRLSEVEGRLALLSDLRRKYGATLAEVLEFGVSTAEDAGNLSQLLVRAEGLADEITKADAVLAEAGERLRESRIRAADRLMHAAREHLLDLGFRDPVLRLDVQGVVPGPGGADKVELQFASDSALTAGPIARVASGGELSRLVLALRLAAGTSDAGVIAFDEIDAGVGGATALALGRKLADLAQGRQILCVTHLPQVAAFADAHFLVSRDGNEVLVARMKDGERLGELSRMLAGMPNSDKGQEHAAELLAIASGEFGGTA